MPTGYSADALIYDSGSNTWRVRPDFDPLLHRVSFAFTDDDAYLDGDVGADEIGSDSNQTAVVTDMTGTEIASGQVYDEEFYAIWDGVNPTIWIERIEIGGQLVGYLVSEPLTEGTLYSQSATNDVDSAPTATTYDSFGDVPCFAPGTLISTNHGRRPVEWLREGDAVITRDGGFQPLRWLGRFRLTRAQMQADAKLHPVRIAAGAMAPGLPDRPLLLSRPHRVVLGHPLMEMTFGLSEAFCAAKDLGDAASPRFVGDGFTYYHLLFDRHEVIQANGLWVESLFAGVSQCRVARASGVQMPPGIRHDDTALPCLKSWEVGMLRQPRRRKARALRAA